MGKYKVTAGQNIFDVALHIYGAPEGVLDLLLNNRTLSYETVLVSGMELEYSDDYVLDSSVIAYNRLHKIVPANGERNVYFKNPPQPQLMVCSLFLDSKSTFFDFQIGGQGDIFIDWGDNSRIEQFVLDSMPKQTSHFFDNTQRIPRQIRIWSTGKIISLNLAGPQLHLIRFYQSAYLETLTIHGYSGDLDFLSVLSELHTLNIVSSKIKSLSSLVYNLKLARLKIVSSDVSPGILDEYLMGIVRRYSNRRNCQIILDRKPSGEFKEPDRDENSSYIIQNGMQAIWVIVNEPAWNEGGFWKIHIDSETYSSEP